MEKRKEEERGSGCDRREIDGSLFLRSVDSYTSCNRRKTLMVYM
jgi:hypothetical protein